MQLSGKEKIILLAIVALIILVPSGTFLLAQRSGVSNKFPSLLDLSPITQPKEVPKDSTLNDLQKDLSGGSKEATPSSNAELSLGPGLKFQLNIEGRPANNQSSKAFLGIAAGNPTNNPQYLLSFNLEVASDGKFGGVSLAGLSVGSSYTAYLKAPAQIATSSAFVAKPTAIDLGILNLITGDLNEDNVIDTNDYNVAKAALRLTPNSPTWNVNIDFNRDNIINNIDLSYIVKNLGKIGASGPWYSKSPTATGSGSLYEPVSEREVVLPNGQGGYWFFMPKIE